MSNIHDEIFLVSACLAGLCTRYDGRSNSSHSCLEKLAGHIWIPICPEQLGGLPTPRTAADIVGGNGRDVLAGSASVIDRQGNDVTGNFIKGARQCLLIARTHGITTALLKARSPSCGMKPVMGVTAALLTDNGIRVIEY